MRGHRKEKDEGEEKNREEKKKRKSKTKRTQTRKRGRGREENKRDTMCDFTSILEPFGAPLGDLFHIFSLKMQT